MEVEPLVMVEPCGMEQLLYGDTNEVREIVLLDSFTYSSAGRDTKVEREHLKKFDPAEAVHEDGLYFTPLVALKSEEVERADTSSTGTVPPATVKVEDIYVEDHVIEYPEEISLEDMFGEKSSPSEVVVPACQQFEHPHPHHPLQDGLLELNAENILEPEEQEPDPRNICHICGRELSDAWNLKRHYLVHSQDRPHKCELCGRGFNQSTHLKAHILTHTERQALQCGDCGKVFSVSRNLRRHILTHSPTKPHICPVCNKGFVQASDLKTHSLTHSGGALPHVCTVCGKGFARSYHLRTHATIHTGEKPHICKVCGKRFRDSGFLRKHGRTHAPNKKPQHACTICGKTFSQSSHLKKHSLVHTRAA